MGVAMAVLTTTSLAANPIIPPRQPPVDDTAPHPDFVLSSPVNRITDQELSEILGAFCGRFQPFCHALLSSLPFSL